MNAAQPVKWRVVEEANGLAFRWGYAGDDLVAEWAGVLSLRATRAGELKTLRPAPGAPHDLVEKTRLGVASAFLRAQRHQHALHASAVVYQGRALICIGASGQGKSTMAGLICRRPGVQLLADDTAAIGPAPGGGVQVLPSESAVWLAPEGSLTKAPVRSLAPAGNPAALSCIVSLVLGSTPPGLELRELRGADAISVLIPSLVRFERTPALWAREFDFVTRLVSQSRVVQASRSRDVGADSVAEVLLGLLVSELR